MERPDGGSHTGGVPQAMERASANYGTLFKSCMVTTLVTLSNTLAAEPHYILESTHGGSRMHPQSVNPEF
jgi:hypothetical protein